MNPVDYQYAQSLFWYPPEAGELGDFSQGTPAFCNELWDEICRAAEKHGWDQVPTNPEMTDNEKLIIMVEEMGEVARAMTYDEGSKAQFKKEVLQLAAMASATYMSMMESVVAEEVLDGP